MPAEKLVRATVLIVALVGITPAAQGSPASRADPRRIWRPSASFDLPTPASYGETCGRVGSWCQPPVSGRIPRALRRSLHLPKLRPGAICPTSLGRRIDNDQFAGIALGRGPVRPVIVASAASGGDLAGGVIPFGRWMGSSWHTVKTLWFSEPRYHGPVFIRGRQLRGSAKIAFGEGRPALFDPQLPPGPTLNGTNGWRQWPGGTYIEPWAVTPGRSTAGTSAPSSSSKRSKRSS
jgi:hypothetical protein